MNELTKNVKQKKAEVLILIELAVLLLLPLPFLKLNLLYVITALIIMLLSKFVRKEKWSEYGFKAIKWKMLFLAIAFGVIYGLVDNFFIEQLITKITGAEPDLSTYASVKGNVGHLIAMLGIGWVIGGFFEEWFFRGYMYNRIQSVIHNPIIFKCTAIVITSIVFAFAHTYQGIGGIVDTGLFAVVMGLLYFALGKNVWYLMIIHGMYDTVGIIRLFLGN
jgi:uncharacterized protein